jgi:hypothetical protein
VGRDYWVKSKQFTNCYMYGPAFVRFAGCVIERNTFDGSERSMFLEVVSDEPHEGEIVLLHCAFINCRFVGVTVLGVPDQIAELKRSFTGFP